MTVTIDAVWLQFAAGALVGLVLILMRRLIWKALCWTWPFLILGTLLAGFAFMVYTDITEKHWPGKWEILRNDLSKMEEAQRLRCLQDFVEHVAPHTDRLRMKDFDALVNEYYWGLDGFTSNKEKVRVIVAPFVDDIYMRDPNASRYETIK